jgi:drug/metabolite transporter (DMT)-like permease
MPGPAAGAPHDEGPAEPPSSQAMPGAPPVAQAAGERLRGFAAAAIGSVGLGFVPLMATQLFRQGFDVPSLLFWRYLVAVTALVGAIALRRIDLRVPWRAGGWKLLLIGGMMGAAQTFCFFQTVRLLGTSLAILTFYIFPAVTLAVEALALRQRVTRFTLVIVVIVISGAALTAWPGLDAGRVSVEGMLWAIPGPFIYGTYLVVTARLMARQSAVTGAVFLYGGLLTSYVLVAIARAVLDRGTLVVPSSLAQWSLVVTIGLIGGAIAITLFAFSVKRLGAHGFGIVSSIELATVVLLGVVVLAEPMAPAQWLGAFLLLAGVLLYGRFGRGATS